MSVEYFSVEPLNRNTSNTFSFEEGSPTIQFALADTEKYLVGNSVRLSFDLQLQTLAGSNVITGTECGISSSAGVHSLFQQVDLSSYKQNIQLESIRNYHKMTSTLLNSGFMDEEEITDKGTNEGLSNSQSYNNVNVGQKSASVRGKQSFTIPIYTGLLMSQPIYLGQAGLKGLKLSLLLLPSSSLITRLGGSTSYKAVLSNVRLIGQYYNPTDEEMRAGKIKSLFMDSVSNTMRQQGLRPTQDELDTAWSESVEMGNVMGVAPYTFNSISGYVDTLNSNNSSHSLNLGLGNVISVFANFTPSEFVNNYAHDSVAPRDLIDSGNVICPITNLKWSRAGVLYPYRFDVESNANDNNFDASGKRTSDRRANIYQGVVDAVKPFYSNHYVSSSYKNSIDTQHQFYGVIGTDTLYSKGAGIGVNFSNLSGSGVDFKFQPLQFEIQSRLKSGNTIRPTTIYLFAVNRQTITFDNGNVNVLS